MNTGFQGCHILGMHPAPLRWCPRLGLDYILEWICGENGYILDMAKTEVMDDNQPRIGTCQGQ